MHRCLKLVVQKVVLGVMDCQEYEQTELKSSSSPYSYLHITNQEIDVFERRLTIINTWSKFSLTNWSSLLHYKKSYLLLYLQWLMHCSSELQVCCHMSHLTDEKSNSALAQVWLRRRLWAVGRYLWVSVALPFAMQIHTRSALTR